MFKQSPNSFILYLLVSELEQNIDNVLHEVSSNCDKLSVLVNKEPTHKRQSAKM
jgi:hypothetical protein